MREAKRRYGKKLQLQMEQSKPRELWQRLWNITDYKATPTAVNIDSSMADELNSFIARFEISSLQAVIPTGAEEETLTVTEHDVRRIFCKH